jgi:hypothetical protein
MKALLMRSFLLAAATSPEPNGSHVVANCEALRRNVKLLRGYGLDAARRDTCALSPDAVELAPTALDDGRRSACKLLGAIVARLVERSSH